MIINKPIKTLFVVLILVFSFSLYAKKNSHSKEFGDYIIHYNTLPSNFLSANIAKQHKLTRSRNRILLNIAVKKKSSGANSAPIPATVTAIATNLTGQLKATTMRKIHDGSGVYYLGEFSVDNNERLKFTISVTPKSQNDTYTLVFKKQFFTK